MKSQRPVGLIVLWALCAQVFGSEAFVSVQTNGDDLLEVDSRHYAVSGPALANMGIAAASVNGDQVKLYSSNCQLTIKSMSSLTGNERSAITGPYNRVHPSGSGSGNINFGYQTSNGGTINMGGSNGNGMMYNNPQIQGNIQGGNVNYGIQVANGGHINYGQSGNIGNIVTGNIGHINTGSSGSLGNIQANSIGSITTNGGSSWSSSGSGPRYVHSGAGLPRNVRTLARSGQNLSFVYSDGSILMKPIACLDSTEQQVMHQVESGNSSGSSSRSSRNNRRRNTNFGNMFGPGFPFN